jgi:hypothetical protein
MWCSASVDHPVRLLLVLVPALIVAGACRDTRVVETQVLVSANTDACERAMSTEARMNAYSVVLYRFRSAAGPDAESPPLCAPCVQDGRCERVGVRCLCGPPRTVGTLGINQQLQQLRFEDLDPSARYCIGLAAVAAPALSVPPDRDVARPCPCNGDALREATGRMCGLSLTAGAVDENARTRFIGAECTSDCAFDAIFGS